MLSRIRNPFLFLSFNPFCPQPPSFAEKECLGTCVQNMQQSDDLSPLEIVEMFAGLSCFLKDSSDVSQTLLDDFRMCQGYAFLCDLMLRYNFKPHSSSWHAPWSLSVLHEHSYKLLYLCPDWNRPRRMNRKMHSRTWSTSLPVWPHMGWRSWNPPASQLEPPSCCLALFSLSLQGKVC